ncbi:hypothetical protein [Mesorhizobium sp. M0579]|uniref:hypothetical protein n=1 Tax=Mesorhizobium sp. M0579 TaxID=2956962 RepID=UPI00333BDB85
MTDQIYQFALQALGSVLLYGGSIAAAAYAIFRFFGEPWLKSKFDKQLEALKSGQEQELERLRFRINTLFDRATKLHQSEFEVLPEMWNRLVMAHNAIGAFTNEFQQYPVLDRMSDVELDEYLHGTALKPSEKDAIRQSGGKTNEYIKRIFGHRCVDSNTALRDYAVYLDARPGCRRCRPLHSLPRPLCSSSGLFGETVASSLRGRGGAWTNTGTTI